MLKYLKLSAFAGLVLSITACGSSNTTVTPGGVSTTEEVIPEKNPGSDLFAGATFEAMQTGTVTKADPIVVPLSSLNVLDKRDVPSEEEGVIAFIGTPISPAEAASLASANGSSELYQHPRTKQFYRKISEGRSIERGQVVAILDDQKADLEVQIANATHKGSQREVVAAKKTVEHIMTMRKISQDAKTLGVGSIQDLAGTEANVARYEAEAEAKATQVDKAGFEIERAKLRLTRHSITAPIGGEVAQIIKKPGESVKAGDTVMQIYNLDRLRVEGFIGLEYTSRLKEGMEVIIEPSHLEAPIASQSIHKSLPILSLAVTARTPEPWIISAGEDGMVYASDRSKRILAGWQHRGPVYHVAVTSEQVEQPRLLTCCADGFARIFDLSTAEGKPLSEKPLKQLDKQHDGGVRAGTFSPDGRFCVTADGSRNIYMWEVATGKMLYAFPRKHNDSVTALHFLPQCKVVSVGKDNVVHIWRIGKEAAVVDRSILHRTGEVAHLGVTEDGNTLLVDHDKASLHLVHPGDGKTQQVLFDPSEAAQFRNFALFSPPQGAAKKRLILSSGNGDGELSLWTAPTATDRGKELYQSVLPGNVPVSAAAFSPNGPNPFLVVGSRSGVVYLWNMPTEADLNRKWTGKVTFIDRSAESSGKNVKFWVEVDNRVTGAPPLLAGTTVNVIIPPKQ